MKSYTRRYLLVTVLASRRVETTWSFLLTPPSRTAFHHHPQATTTFPRFHDIRLFASTDDSPTDKVVKEEEEEKEQEILGPLASAKRAGNSVMDDESNKAATGTVNERLLAELEQVADKEKYGARSPMGKKLGLESFRSSKTDQEREAAIQEARNLNGVNPIVAIGGSLFALAAAAALWWLTNYLAEFFALHPVDSDVYFVSRVSAVFRNVAMGLVSLASGFFGVTGLGILLLGLRVAYGVATGELDPTPLKKNKEDQVELPNVWDLMLNKKPDRRRNRK